MFRQSEAVKRERDDSTAPKIEQESQLGSLEHAVKEPQFKSTHALVDRYVEKAIETKRTLTDGGKVSTWIRSHASVCACAHRYACSHLLNSLTRVAARRRQRTASDDKWRR
eukprot:6214786-Pleurochrysis_carterae.AAC.1